MTGRERLLTALAGGGGGFILAPSDHFFEAEDALLRAFADEAHARRYPATSRRCLAKTPERSRAVSSNSSCSSR